VHAYVHIACFPPGILQSTVLLFWCEFIGKHPTVSTHHTTGHFHRKKTEMCKQWRAKWGGKRGADPGHPRQGHPKSEITKI